MSKILASLIEPKKENGRWSISIDEEGSGIWDYGKTIACKDENSARNLLTAIQAYALESEVKFK